MKILPINVNTIAKQTESTNCKKITETPLHYAIANLERYAEEMNPKEYLKMRSYLTKLEIAVRNKNRCIF